MQKNKHLVIIAILMLIFAVILLITKKNRTILQDHQITKVQIGNQEIKVEVVNSSSSITKGLSGRAQIGADGMLFIFPNQRQVTFWMKEMKFALDLIWINNNQISEITTNVPAPKENTPINLLPTYQPQSQINMVLEVTAGTAQKWHLKPGDKFVIR